MNAEVDNRQQQVAQKLSAGYQWLRSEQPLRAQQVFEAALVLDPDNGRAHAWRAVALLQQTKDGTQSPRSAPMRRARKQARAAIEAEISEALRLNADDSFVRYLCAHVLRQVGKPRRALELLEENASLIPDYETTWLEIARCRMRMMQARQAEVAARRAVECAPLSASAHEVLAWILGSRGKRREAQNAWQTALELNPESAQAYMALGQHYFRTGHVAQAEHYLSEGLRLKPNSTVAQSQLRETRIMRRFAPLRLINQLAVDFQASWKAKGVLLLIVMLAQVRNSHLWLWSWLFWGVVAGAGFVTLWRIICLLRPSAARKSGFPL